MFRDIFNTYRQAFRVYVRQRTHPLSLEEAEEKKLFWSRCYMVFGLGSLIVATYITRKEEINFAYKKDVSKDQAVLDQLIGRPTRIVKYKNFEKVEEYDYKPTPRDKASDLPSAKNE